MNKTAIVLALKPRFAQAILDGRKTIEVRRRLPRIETPARTFLYQTADSTGSGRIMGECILRAVHSTDHFDMIDLLNLSNRSCASINELAAYWRGVKSAVMLGLERPLRYYTPILLPNLQRECPNHKITHPQSWLYWPPEVVAAVDRILKQQRPIHEIVEDIVADIPESEMEKLPTDLATNLDDYLYGGKE